MLTLAFTKVAVAQQGDASYKSCKAAIDRHDDNAILDDCETVDSDLSATSNPLTALLAAHLYFALAEAYQRQAGPGADLHSLRWSLEDYTIAINLATWASDEHMEQPAEHPVLALASAAQENLIGQLVSRGYTTELRALGYLPPLPDACLDHEAQLLHETYVVFPDAPKPASMGPVVVTVKVQIAADGSVADAAILSSSGSSQVDRSALRPARGSTYKAATKPCQPIAGSYTLVVRDY